MTRETKGQDERRNYKYEEIVKKIQDEGKELEKDETKIKKIHK